MDLEQKVRKYSLSGPRYTSYPTAPQWSEEVGAFDFEKALHRVLPREPLALYLHLPFCESLCYYCGCNIQIQKNKHRSLSYVSALINEISRARSIFKARFVVSQMSWGGGTPTFLSESEIEQLFKAISDNFEIEPNAEVSIEIDPRVTSSSQLKTLRALGFNRVSLGVQDFNPKVQKAVHRVQSLEATESILELCRSLKFTGINFDLIYGLPFQSYDSFNETLREVIRLRPDRIALYNYAHLPHLIAHQKILDSMPMPQVEERLHIFLSAYRQFRENGYISVGLDHFATESDELAKAIASQTLYRNFMGYTVKRGAHLIGFGASAISEVGGAYFQNIKNPDEYEKAVESGFATRRGLWLSKDDLQRKWIIQNIMCRFGVSFDDFARTFDETFQKKYTSELSLLGPLVDDGLIQIKPNSIEVNKEGRLFLRNIAMIFDSYLKNSPITYSKTL